MESIVKQGYTKIPVGYGRMKSTVFTGMATEVGLLEVMVAQLLHSKIQVESGLIPNH